MVHSLKSNQVKSSLIRSNQIESDQITYLGHLQQHQLALRWPEDGLVDPSSQHHLLPAWGKRQPHGLVVEPPPEKKKRNNTLDLLYSSKINELVTGLINYIMNRNEIPLS